MALPKATYVFALGNLLKNRGSAPGAVARGQRALAEDEPALEQEDQRLTGAVELHVPVKAVDYDFLGVRSGVCGGTRLDWYTGNGFEYWPWNGPPGKPA